MDNFESTEFQGFVCQTSCQPSSISDHICGTRRHQSICPFVVTLFYRHQDFHEQTQSIFNEKTICIVWNWRSTVKIKSNKRLGHCRGIARQRHTIQFILQVKWINYLQLNNGSNNICLWQVPWRVTWPWNRGQGSFKLTGNDTVRQVAYLCSIITMALSCTVCDTFDFEKCCDLEIQVEGHSRWWKPVP